MYHISDSLASAWHCHSLCWLVWTIGQKFTLLMQVLILVRFMFECTRWWSDLNYLTVQYLTRTIVITGLIWDRDWKTGDWKPRHLSIFQCWDSKPKTRIVQEKPGSLVIIFYPHYWGIKKCPLKDSKEMRNWNVRSFIPESNVLLIRQNLN